MFVYMCRNIVVLNFQHHLLSAKEQFRAQQYIISGPNSNMKIEEEMTSYDITRYFRAMTRMASKRSRRHPIAVLPHQHFPGVHILISTPAVCCSFLQQEAICLLRNSVYAHFDLLCLPAHLFHTTCEEGRIRCFISLAAIQSCVGRHDHNKINF
jgi:hypothetical protein